MPRVASCHLHTIHLILFLPTTTTFPVDKWTLWPKPLPLHQLQRLQNMYHSGEKNTDTDQVSECKAKFGLNLLPLIGGTLLMRCTN